MAKKKYCFLDETGNTGLNHFDSNQENFVQGCILSDCDLDSELTVLQSSLLSLVGKPELHANELGIGGINKISTILLDLIKSEDLTFVFTVIEKPYHLALMIFHLIYDDGLNPAVNKLALHSRPLRLNLSYNFIVLVNESHLKKFWLATQNKDQNGFVQVLKGIQENLNCSILDHRSKELLNDALEFTISNPTDIFSSMRFDEAVSANLSAFSLMINTINGMYKDKSVEIVKLVHDEQKEFGRFLNDSFSLFSKVFMPSTPMALTTDMANVNLITQEKLSLVNSNQSFGLQLTDIVLWVFKRIVFQGETRIDNKLASEILERAHWDGISLFHHQRGLVDCIDHVSKLPYPKVNKEGMQLIRELESQRWKSKK